MDMWTCVPDEVSEPNATGGGWVFYFGGHEHSSSGRVWWYSSHCHKPACEKKKLRMTKSMNTNKIWGPWQSPRFLSFVYLWRCLWCNLRTARCQEEFFPSAVSATCIHPHPTRPSIHTFPHAQNHTHILVLCNLTTPNKKSRNRFRETRQDADGHVCYMNTWMMRILPHSCSSLQSSQSQIKSHLFSSGMMQLVRPNAKAANQSKDSWKKLVFKSV